LRPVEGQTILVTGATDGLGCALALDLARRGATVLLHGRSDAHMSDAAREIREATGSARLRAYRAGFSSRDEVRRLAERVLAAEERLDVLTGRYFDGLRPARADAGRRTPRPTARLWRLSEKHAGIDTSTQPSPAPSEIT
jgi:NAD(P)-dependent dehydrogenase (short-subunit alcohol dehydrogenase family)